MDRDGLASLSYHWFGNTWDGFSAEELARRVSVLNWAGYKSVLLPYHNQFGDNFVRAARAVNPLEDIKYNIAIRTTSLTPEYCSMLAYSFSSIAPGKLILNLLTGTPDEIENKGDLYDNREFLRNQLSSFAESLQNNRLFKKVKPEIMISGRHPDILNVAKKYADYTATDPISIEREMQISDILLGYLNAPGLTVAVDLAIFDDETECEGFVKNYNNHSLIAGNREQIKDRFRQLARLGISNILIAKHPAYKNPELIHDFVYDLNHN